LLEAAADAVENKSIQALPLLGRGQTGIPDRARRALGQASAVSRLVAAQHFGSKLEILGQFHANEVWCQEQEQRRIELTTMDRSRRPVQQFAEVDTEDVHHLDRRFIGSDRAQRLQMRLTRLRSDDEELTNACPLFPRFDKFVHDPVKRPSPQGRPAWERPGGGVDSVLHRRSPQNSERLRQVVRQTFYDD
jgi:hypothetical protein